jgi:hypothetical protein
VRNLPLLPLLSTNEPVILNAVRNLQFNAGIILRFIFIFSDTHNKSNDFEVTCRYFEFNAGGEISFVIELSGIAL